MARTRTDKRAHVRDNRPRGLSVAEGCRLTAISRSTYYWSRRIIGYAMSRRIDARLTLAALDVAISLRSPLLAASTTPTAGRNTPP